MTSRKQHRKIEQILKNCSYFFTCFMASAEALGM
jgi:hypothetical protein